MKKILSKLQIYHWDYIFVIKGSLSHVPSHSHNAIQIFLNREGRQKIRIGNKILTEPLVYVDKNTEHEVLLADKKQICLLIDGDSQIASHFSHNFLKGQSFSTDREFLDFCIPDNPQDMKKYLYQFLDSKGCHFCSLSDRRIQKVKSLIDNDEEKKLSLKWLAEEVYLSESRLAHLFKEEVGIPLRKYLLWKRLISALNIIMGGNDLTYAAHYSGFSDSAHLSRTFKSNFGLNLSQIFKNSKFIQFYSL